MKEGVKMVVIKAIFIIILVLFTFVKTVEEIAMAKENTIVNRIINCIEIFVSIILSFIIFKF